MKNFKLDNFLKTIKLYFVFLIVGIMILSLGGFKISSAEALVGENSIKSVNIENNLNMLDSEAVYNIDSLTKKMFGDVQIESSEYLYNLDGASDYIYVTFENGGYAVYYKDTMELLEYSAQGSLNYQCKNYKYYGGPSLYLTKQNDCFVDTITGKILDISSVSAKAYSDDIREALTKNYISSELQTSFDYSLSDSYVSNFENKISGYPSLVTDSKEINTEGNLNDGTPSFDSNSLIRVSGGTYITNYQYFLSEPLHGQNDNGSCGAVAAQLLLSYNNYYNDRRIIADKYLNGGDSSTSEKEKNPNLCTDPILMTPDTLGTRGYYEDGRDDSNSYFKYILDYIPVSTNASQLAQGLNDILNKRNNEIYKKIDFSVDYKFGSLINAVETRYIKSEIDSGRPVILALQERLGGTDHAVVAYGYKNYTYPNSNSIYSGYITHFGWKSKGSENYTNIWVNSSWCVASFSLKINHNHDYYKEGTIESIGRIEYKCRTCGHRTGKAPDGYLNIINVGKQGSSWKILVENPLSTSVDVYYNSKMCNLSDAKIWSGLKHIEYKKLAGGRTTTLEIQEYGTATSIALSYISNGVRYFTYANQLNTNGGLSIMYGSKSVPSYTIYGMTVRNLGKNGSTWLIELTNNTGSKRTFDYNNKMCNAGDAEKWTGLSHQATVTLNNGETTDEPLEITEYGTATSIAISYLESDTCRKIFYANNLSTSCTMSANASEIDPTADSKCVAAGTLITLADGSQKAVEALTGDEMLLVWNMYTGTFDIAPILFIDSEPISTYEVIKLYFSDGTTVDVISEHGFWDYDLNEYVYLDDNASEYIGHWFNKYSVDELGARVQLVNVEIVQEETTAWSPVTYGHLCYYVNGMLSMPGGIGGLFNIFEVDSETMKYDEVAMQQDIEAYGLFTYEEFAEIISVPETMFDAVNGQYLKIAIAKGLVDIDTLNILVERYAQFF